MEEKDGKGNEELLAQLAAKDEELLKLKEELLRLKTGGETAAVAAPPAASPQPAAPQPQPKKALLSHLPYECVSTQSPDGRDHWPNVSRVVPPQEYREVFSDMVKVGCYCWRIVNKVVFSSRGVRKQERVLAITAEFLFLCDLSANINRVLRCRDVERVLVQEKDDIVVMVFKAYDQCEEHSIMLELITDARNPSTKPLHPIFALNYTRKPKTKTDVKLLRVASTTDLHRHPAAGSFHKPQGYLAPHLKIQKWRETGKWPSGSSSIPPAARSVPGAHKLRAIETQMMRTVKFTDTQNQEIAIHMPVGQMRGLELVVAGSAPQPFESIVFDAKSLTLTVGSYSCVVTAPPPGPQLDASLRELAMLAVKARVPAAGLPIPARRQKAALIRSASVDSIDRAKQASQRDASANSLQSLVTEIKFTDTDGDVSVLRLIEGKLEWWANGSLEVAICTTIKFHDGVLTSGPVSARVAVPVGDERKEMLRLIAYVSRLVGVKAVGLPLLAPNETMPLPVVTTSLIEKREGCDAKSDTCSNVSASTASYRHNPYATDDDELGASPSSSFSSNSSMHYMQQPFDYYRNPSPVHSDHTDASHPSLLSSLDALPHPSDRSDTSVDLQAQQPPPPPQPQQPTPQPQQPTPQPQHPLHPPHPQHYNPTHIASAPSGYMMTDVMTGMGMSVGMGMGVGMNMPPMQPQLQECMRLAVMFKHGRRGEYASMLAVPPSTYVVVEHPDGVDIALVVGVRQGGRLSDKWRILRSAAQEEIMRWRGLVEEENEALGFMRGYVEQLGVPITLHRAEYQIDKKKLTFHFSSEVLHPDFVSLVHQAHARFGCRIWMNNCQPRTGERGELIDLSSQPIPTF